MTLKANFHTHTLLCDGKNTPEEMVQQALKLGFEQLGFSGHMDPDIHMDFDAYTAEIKRLQAEYQDRIDILLGVELDTLYDPSIAAKAEYVVGSTHFLDVPAEIPVSVDNSPEMMKMLADTYFEGDYYRLAKSYYETETSIAKRFPVTFIGHFDLVTRFNDDAHFLDESDPRYTVPALEAMEYLVKQGLPFEINCGAVNRGRKAELYPNRMLLKALHDFGGQIFINSDAHDAAHLNGGFEIAVQTAIECGFGEVCILKHDSRGKMVIDTLPLY